jgi:hypothetical protein
MHVAAPPLRFGPVDDGTIGFVRNAFDEQLDALFAEILEDMFGPEPAEDD